MQNKPLSSVRVAPTSWQTEVRRAISKLEQTAPSNAPVNAASLFPTFRVVVPIWGGVNIIYTLLSFQALCLLVNDWAFRGCPLWNLISSYQWTCWPVGFWESFPVFCRPCPCCWHQIQNVHTLTKKQIQKQKKIKHVVFVKKKDCSRQHPTFLESGLYIMSILHTLNWFLLVVFVCVVC